MNEARARRYMQQAIDVMRASVAEPRDDGKVSPTVGAVLAAGDKTVTACRGELRDGDHAEFTLLERKCRDRRLDGAALFVTLEPCAPGARSERKLGCTERIILARIKSVWIGIEDPDPTVAGRGIEHLRANGIEVQMFDRDLQQEIIDENKRFLDQALERADGAAAEVEIRGVPSSPLDGVASRAGLADLSATALARYGESIDLPDRDRVLKVLKQQALIRRQKNEDRPTKFGLILFGAEPRNFLPQAGLIATITYADGQQESREFAGPLVEIPGEVEQWLRVRLPNVIDRRQMTREEVAPIPFEPIREGIVNALVHRNYEIEGAKCQLQVTPEAITIASPGVPAEPITLEQLQNFTAPTVSRNPKLHYVFRQMRLAEEAGLGMETMRALRQQHTNVTPRFAFEGPYLVLALHRTAESAATQVAGIDINRELNAEERRGWEFLLRADETTRREYAAELGVPIRTAGRHLAHFADLGLTTRISSGAATRYRVTQD